MLKLGIAATGSIERYVLLKHACELAVAGSRLPAAIAAVDALAATHDVDALALAFEATRDCLANAQGREMRAATAIDALEWASLLHQSDQLELAVRVLDLPALKRLRTDAEQNAEARRSYLELDQAPDVVAYRKVRGFIEQLGLDPEHIGANHAVGMYHCFDRGDFGGGLPLLVKGQQASYAEIASLDLKAPGDVPSRCALAEKWILLAGKHAGVRRNTALARAKHWLQMAESQVGAADPLGRERVRLLLEKVDASLSSEGPIKLERAPRGEKVDALARRVPAKSRMSELPLPLQGPVEDALQWLSRHQSDDGRWDSDGFSAQCPVVESDEAAPDAVESGEAEPEDAEADVCGDSGYAQHDVGVTGLALLALMSEGSTMASGSYQDQIARGIDWLLTQQQPETGLIGTRSTHAFLYDHAIATLAVCEAYSGTKADVLGNACRSAINYIQRARNPYSAWRYEVPPDGNSDTSVTGWMMLALQAAKHAGIPVDTATFEGGMNHIDEVTDLATGRVGYMKRGETSSRILGTNDQFPPNKGEALTAVGLLCRIFTGRNDVKKFPELSRHADLLRLRLPESDPGIANDAYYWYYGTHAMYQMGGAHWKTWESRIQTILLENQRDSGDAKGSWDAATDAWGFAGGRVYTTALCALTLQVYVRYPRMVGSGKK